MAVTERMWTRTSVVLLAGAFSLVASTVWADTSPVSANAQAKDSTAGQSVPPVKAEIVVTPERGPVQRSEVAASVTVLTRQQIEALPAQSLDEVIGAIPGMTMFFDNLAAGAPMISARGFFGGGEVEYVKLLIDGVPAGDVESGLIDWRHVRTADIERIEVLHGPGSSLYGDTSMGGVIEVFTRQRNTGNDSGEVRASGGSFSTRSGDLLFRRSSGPLRIGLSLLDSTADGYRAHSHARDRGGDLSLQILGAASRLYLTTSLASKDREEPGELTAAEAAADPRASEGAYHLDREQTDRRRIVAGYDSFGATSSLRILLHGEGRATDFPRTLPLAPGFFSTLFRNLKSHGLGGVFELSRDWQNATVRAGSDLARASLDETYSRVTPAGDRGASVASAAVRRDQASAFVTADWIPLDRLRIASGLRWDDIRDARAGSDSHRTAWSPRLGATWQLGSAPAPLALFVQLARAFKAPTLDQLFDPRPFPGLGGVSFTVSNPSLQPQRAHNVEIGIDRSLPSVAWSLSAYHMKVTDEIDFDPTTFLYRNLGGSRHTGIEAMADWRHGLVQPLLLYTWTHVTSNDNPGQQLKNIPEHVAQLLLRTTLPGAVGVTLRGRWEHGRFADDEGVFSLGDVRTIDAKVSRAFGPLRVDAEALNLSNQHYPYIGSILRDFRGNPTLLEFPAPGRAVRVSLAWRY